MDKHSYLLAFLSDAEQHIALIRQSLKQLEEHSQDASALADLHRGFHTLAGTAGTMQLQELSQLCRKHEAAAQSLKESKQPATADHLKAWQSGVEEIEASLVSLSSAKQENI